MNQPNVASPPRRRPRKWLRRVLFTLLFLVLMGAGGVFYYLWSAESALHEIMAELDRDDPGWRLAEIIAKRKVLPDAENSALHILTVNKFRAGQSFITAGAENLFDDLHPQVQLNEEQGAYLEKRFELLHNAVVEARKLKDMPDGQYSITYAPDYFSTLIPQIQETREIFVLLQWDAASRGQAGDGDGALESGLALQQAVRSLGGDESMLIAMLVRCAGNAISMGTLERTLAQAQFTAASDPSLKNMQTAIARELKEPWLLTALRGERAGVHQFFQATAEGKVRSGTVIGAPGGGDGLLTSIPGFLTIQHAAILRFHTKLVEAAKMPEGEREKRFNVLELNIKDEPILVRQLAPAIIKIAEAEQRTQASLRCGLAALAAERFRIANDRWPETLDELVKTGFLEAVPTDPYDHKPLRVKRTAESLTIYSVGKDRIDNGGNIIPDHPTDPGTDQGFRLWDISRRRQPNIMTEQP